MSGVFHPAALSGAWRAREDSNSRASLFRSRVTATKSPWGANACPRAEPQRGSSYIRSCDWQCGSRGVCRSSLGDLDVPDGYAVAILAWYSVIHLAPDELTSVLREFARCIAPGGSLLVGFFEGDAVVPFPHAVSTAYFWPVGDMSAQLRTAGFKVHEVRTRTDPGKRPHAAIIAHRTDMSIA